MILNRTNTLGVAAVLTAVATTPLRAQAPTAPPDPMLASMQQAAVHVRGVFTTAAEQMSEEDYAFKPTPEVRSFGQLLAHVADSNYWFCSTATGETAPMSGIEKSRTTKAEIQAALAASFAYCEQAYAAMADDAKAKRMAPFMGTPRPALVILNFRTYHSLLHWGNAITYMRLRGKVPPST